MNQYHITKENGQWCFKTAGGAKKGTAKTKPEIIAHMQRYMSSKTGTVRIHLVDGSFDEERTYPRKNDPQISKG
jgi:Uncharacterized protein conserved in bacteria (DUF2188)